MSTATNLRGICCRVLGLVFFPIAVWRRTAQERREADRQPSDGKIKAAMCGPVERGRNEATSARWRDVHFGAAMCEF
jgi:hypothetical protein